MKNPYALIAVFLLAACSSAQFSSPTYVPLATPTNPWMGQTVPGANPQPFGIGFVASSFHSSPTFTPDGTVAYWAGDYIFAKIYTSLLEDGVWTDPAIINFSEEMSSYRDPFVSPDGKMLYFISEQVIPGSPAAGKENIWMMEKEGDGWGTPQPLPETINALSLHWTISVALNYNLYFSANEGNDDIYLSRYINNGYTEPERLDASINSDGLEFTPNIAPDESYLLFSRLADSNSTPYLYITYSQGSGWSEAQKVENVGYCISPIVTPDRQYVIYMKSPTSIEWRDTSFIEELHP